MKDIRKSPYFAGMLAGFGAIAMSVLFFFFLFRLDVILAGLDEVMKILAPFVYGGVIAYLLRPVCNSYEGLFRKWLPKKYHKVADALAVALSIVTGLLVVYLLIIMMVPELIASIKTLWTSLPDHVSNFEQWARKTFSSNEEAIVLFRQIYDAVYAEMDIWIQETVLPNITNIVSGVGMSVWNVFVFVKDFLIGIIVAVYLLGSRKRFAKQGVLLIRGAFKPKTANMILNEIKFIDRMFGGFIDGKIVDSAIIGVLCYIGCVVFRFPNALLISVIVGVTNVIPFFGPFIGAIPSILLILIVDPVKAFWFALFVLALQQLDGNVIGPKILGDRTGLASFWVLFSIVLFGGLYGLVGMVICVPFFAVVYDVIKKLVYKGLAKNGCLDIWKEYKQDFGDEVPLPRSAEPEPDEE